MFERHVSITSSSQQQSIEKQNPASALDVRKELGDLRNMFQQSVADIQSQVNNFMGVVANIEHSNGQRLDDLHGEIMEPLQSLPGSASVTRDQTDALMNDPADTALGTSESVASVGGDMLQDAFERSRLKRDVRSRRLPDMEPIKSPTEFALKNLELLSKLFGGPSSYSTAQNLIVATMKEAAHTIEICQREYELYPEPSLREKLITLYTLVVDLVQQAQIWATGKRSITRILPSPGPEFDRQIEELRKASDEVMQEVEYLDRRETRLASIRLKHMERDQRRILNAVQEQKKLIANMQEQRQILDMVRDQQQVLQSMQNLLMQLPLPTKKDIEGSS